jgi:hypothetical protein
MMLRMMLHVEYACNVVHIIRSEQCQQKNLKSSHKHARRVTAPAYRYQSQKLMTQNMPGKNVSRNVFLWWQECMHKTSRSRLRSCPVRRQKFNRTNTLSMVSSHPHLSVFLPLWCRSGNRLGYVASESRPTSLAQTRRSQNRNQEDCRKHSSDMRERIVAMHCSGRSGFCNSELCWRKFFTATNWKT